MSSSNIKYRKKFQIGAVLVPIALYVIGALVFFRWQIFSKFDLVFGGRSDARADAFLHEHVYRWLFIHSGLLSPPFFYNKTETLGYTDAYLLDQAIYAPLRLIGAEPLLALSFVPVFLSVVAYMFFWLLLRRLQLSVPIASLAALIFTFSNNLFLKSVSLQMFAVYYLPIVAYCAVASVIDLHIRPRRAYLLGACAAGLYGLIFSTSYYMAWFFGLALLIFAPIATLTAWPVLRNWWARNPTAVITLGLVGSVSFLSTLAIFVVIYAPVLGLGEAWNFNEYLKYAPQPNDILNVGMENLIWSKLIRSLDLVSDSRLGFDEVSIALTPLLQVLLFASAFLAFRPRFWPTSDLARISRAFVLGGTGVCVLFFIVTIKFGDASLFHFLYTWVPGAIGIRAGYRGMVVANLFAVMAIGLTFNRIFQAAMEKPHTFLGLARLTALTALLALAAIEQVNLAEPTQLSRKFEREHLSAVGNAPRECRSFYGTAQANSRPWEVQIDAMMIALAQHIPTINGYSSLLPPGWDFMDTKAADYEQRAQRWAVSRGIVEGLCRVDVERGTWSSVAVDRDVICAGGACLPPHSRRFGF
jgi:hypothetical protein